MGDVLGNSMDMRGGQSKKSDEAGKGIKEMGTSEFLFYLSYYSYMFGFDLLRYSYHGVIGVGFDLLICCHRQGRDGLGHFDQCQ
jgi:hypothetical protein